MKVDTDVEELEALRAERTAYKEACQWLQERNTALVEHARRQSIRANVAQFHHVTDNPILPYPQVPSPARCSLRMSLMGEELLEVAAAMYVGNPNALRELEGVRAAFMRIVEQYAPAPDIVALADGLCDTDYVVEGTRLEFGIDGAGVLAEVQRANLAKAGGPKREDGKQLKGPNWTPPDISAVLREQGWLG